MADILYVALFKENKFSNLDLYTSTTLATPLGGLWVPWRSSDGADSRAGRAPLANAGDPRRKRKSSWTSPSGKCTVVVALACAKWLQSEPWTASTKEQQNVEASVPVLARPAETSSMIFSLINCRSAFGHGGAASSMLPGYHLRTSCMKLKQHLAQQFFPVRCKIWWLSEALASHFWKGNWFCCSGTAPETANHRSSWDSASV